MYSTNYCLSSVLSAIYFSVVWLRCRLLFSVYFSAAFYFVVVFIFHVVFHYLSFLAANFMFVSFLISFFKSSYRFYLCRFELKMPFTFYIFPVVFHILINLSFFNFKYHFSSDVSWHMFKTILIMKLWNIIFCLFEYLYEIFLTNH